MTDEERRRCWAHMMRPAQVDASPPHWEKPAIRTGINVMDGGPLDDDVGGVDDLIANVAADIGVSTAQAARWLLDDESMYALVMGNASLRTALDALQSAVETATGELFQRGANGNMKDARARRRFVRMLQYVVKRRLGELRSEDDQ